MLKDRRHVSHFEVLLAAGWEIEDDNSVRRYRLQGDYEPILSEQRVLSFLLSPLGGDLR